MKIAVLLQINPYFTEGASANRWQSLIDGLNKYQVQVELIICGGFQSNEEKSDFSVKEKSGLLKFHYLSNMVSGSLFWRRIDKYIVQPYLSKIFRVKAIKNLNEIKPEVLWADHETTLYRIAIHYKKKNPTACLFCELSEFMDNHRYYDINRLQANEAGKRLHVFEEEFFPALNKIAYMTRTLGSHYQNISKNPPQALHLPMTVDLERFKQKSEHSIFPHPYVSFIGVMNNQKDGVDILIRAFAQISNRFTKINLALFGFAHPDTPGQLALINELGMNDRIHYYGSKSRDEIVPIIQGSQLLVLPRPDSHQAKGGFPTKLGEYLASGNAVCATRVGELPEYLEDGVSVFFADPGSVNSLADAMQKALENPQLAKKVGNHGRLIAEKYFNNTIQSQLLYNFLKPYSEC